MKFFQYCIVLALLSLTGCGSDSRSSDVYYIHERDVYLRIFDDGEVNKYRCSVNHGYREDSNFSGQLDNNQLEVTWNKRLYPYIVEAEKDSLEIILREEVDEIEVFQAASTLSPILAADKFFLIKKEEIPVDCNNSAVNIISITPENWSIESNNSITVNYDYRRQSEEELKIQIAYLNGKLLSHVNTTLGPEVIVEDTSQSNDTLTMPLNTQALSSNVLSIYVLMYDIEGSINKLVAYDRVDIVNTEPSGNADASLNTDCLTCIGSSLNIGPFD